MNILILSTSNPYKTAGIAAYSIFKGLRSRGHNVKLVVKVYDKYEKDITCVDNKFDVFKKKWKRRINKYILKKKYTTNIDFSYQDDDYFRMKDCTRRILNKSKIKPDIIYIVFAQNFLNYKIMFKLQKFTNAPIIWQFADMAPFTGGCHYSWDCNKYTKSCGNCPALFSNTQNDLSKKILADKLYYANKIKFIAVIGSDWLIRKAKKSSVLSNKSIKKIFLPVNDEVFFPLLPSQKSKLMKEYNIPTNKINILIAANSLIAKRKGIIYIANALKEIKSKYDLEKINMIIIGKDFNKIKHNFPQEISYKYFGQVNRKILPDIYRISDFFVSASLEDVGPYTLTEALLCGIPVVSFDTGFANDFVVDYQTGFLVEEETSKCLAKGIMKMLELDYDKFKRIKVNARKRTKELLDKDNIIDSHIELINQMENNL